MPPIVVVIQLAIDHSRLNHHVTLLRQTVKLAPRLLVQLMAMVFRPQSHLYLQYSTIDHRDFLDPIEMISLKFD